MFKSPKIAIVGLGYVGLPLAIEFCKKYEVIGFDIDENRISDLLNGIDKTKEVTELKLKEANNLILTKDINCLSDVDVYIVTVPTPVDKNNSPDLTALSISSKLVGSFLKKNNIIIYESTVFPGCTEEICVPILSEASGLKYNEEFFCGYSPERINPGDREHTLSKIVKITSGSTKDVAQYIDFLYGSIIEAGTYKASCIKVAEAAKVIENTQRDVNIALINELAMIFDKMNLDTSEVLEAAGTKWNFIPFRPGLVGGHCIGVDPYYLTYKSLELGYNPEMILAGRKINDNMGKFIADNSIALLNKIAPHSYRAKIAILGLTFKENCPDLRNTKVVTVIKNLQNHNCDIIVSDECSDPDEWKKMSEYPISPLKNIQNQDMVIVAVCHDRYLKLTNKDWRRLLKPNGIIVDVKSVFKKENFGSSNFLHWKL